MKKKSLLEIWLDKRTGLGEAPDSLKSRLGRISHLVSSFGMDENQAAVFIEAASLHGLRKCRRFLALSIGKGLSLDESILKLIESVGKSGDSSQVLYLKLMGDQGGSSEEVDGDEEEEEEEEVDGDEEEEEEEEVDGDEEEEEEEESEDVVPQAIKSISSGDYVITRQSATDDDSEAIRWVQEVLVAYGTMEPFTGRRERYLGSFTLATEKAVKEVQTLAEVDPTGEINSDTVNLLLSLYKGE